MTNQEVLAGRTKLYGDIAEGRLKARKIGDRTIVLHTEYLAYLDALPTIEPKAVGEGV